MEMRRGTMTRVVVRAMAVEMALLAIAAMKKTLV